MPVVLLSLMLIGFANADQTVAFTGSYKVKDRVCCGSRFSEIAFENVYLRSSDGKIHARVTCSGTFAHKTLKVLVNVGNHFDYTRAREFTIEKETTELCHAALEQMSQVSDQAPFVLDLLSRN